MQLVYLIQGGRKLEFHFWVCHFPPGFEFITLPPSSSFLICKKRTLPTFFILGGGASASFFLKAKEEVILALQALEAQSQPLTFAFSAKAAVGNTERSERGWLWPADRIFNFNVRYNMPKAFEAKSLCPGGAERPQALQEHFFNSHVNYMFYVALPRT